MDGDVYLERVPLEQAGWLAGCQETSLDGFNLICQKV